MSISHSHDAIIMITMCFTTVPPMQAELIFEMEGLSKVAIKLCQANLYMAISCVYYRSYFYVNNRCEKVRQVMMFHDTLLSFSQSTPYSMS